jgi:hypothetical protein
MERNLQRAQNKSQEDCARPFTSPDDLQLSTGSELVMTFTEVWNSNGRPVYTRFRMLRVGEVIEFDPEDSVSHGIGASNRAMARRQRRAPR